MNKIRKNFIHYTFSFGVLLTTIYCSTSGQASPRYFKEDFKCSKEFIESEKDTKYLVGREAYIQNLIPEFNGESVIIAGESTAALFNENLIKEHLPGYKITNRAIPGETTVLFLSSLDSHILKYRPSTIVLAIGGNDLLGGRCLTTIERNVFLILTKIQTQLPGTKVVLVSIPPVVDWNVSSVAVYFNTRLQLLASASRNIEYLDLWPMLADPEKPVLAQKFRIIDKRGKVDRVHFNKQGYELFAKELKKKLSGR